MLCAAAAAVAVVCCLFAIARNELFSLNCFNDLIFCPFLAHTNLFPSMSMHLFFVI